MKVLIDLLKYTDLITPISCLAEHIEFKVLLMLEEYTKDDLQYLINICDDEEVWGKTFEKLAEELKKIMSYNKGIRNSDLIHLEDKRDMTPLDKFFDTGVIPPPSEETKHKVGIQGHGLTLWDARSIQEVQSDYEKHLKSEEE